MKSRSILIVDDEPLIAMMLQDWLVELGFDVVGPVSTVESALALIADGPPQGAILDVTLGRGTSYPIAESLRKLDIPVVFATGLGYGDLDGRFADCMRLPKPFDFDALKRVMESF